MARENVESAVIACAIPLPRRSGEVSKPAKQPAGGSTAEGRGIQVPRADNPPARAGNTTMGFHLHHSENCLSNHFFSELGPEKADGSRPLCAVLPSASWE